MAEPKLYYLSKSNANLPSLKSVECSRAEIASTLGDLEAKYRQLSHQAGPGARLVCDLSHNNMTCEHLQYVTQLLIASPVQLFALDLSWNRIFAPTWDEVLPIVKQLLTKATYVDLAGNYHPALDPERLELKDMLKQNASFAAPNLYLGGTPWMRQWTSKAHEFRRQAYRFACGSLAVFHHLCLFSPEAGCREEADEDTDTFFKFVA